MPFEVGQRVGDYEVVQMLGAGGMGHVYRVRNIISNRTEAMKVLLPDLTAEPDLATRFVSEIRTLASFDHPNIAQLHTALLVDNQLIMMMEFVEGYTLEQMAGQRTQPIHEVAGYVMQALSALAYAHERGVVHRDIKPANLMVTSHGIVKLMDFGIAKSNNENLTHTRPGTTIGSMYYMSPEQVRGNAVDARSDLYSMGVVLYELLAGRRPFEADSTFGILNQQLNVAPQPPIEVNPSLPPSMNQVILKAMAKDTSQRFQSAEEFRTALRPFVNAPTASEAASPSFVPKAPVAEQPLTQPVPLAPQPVVSPQQPGFADATPPAAPQWQTHPPVSMPARRSGNKAVWIATGAIAAVLALVAVIFAVPMLKKASAASNSSPASASSSTPPPSAVINATAPTVDPTPTPDTGGVSLPNSGASTAAGTADRWSPQVTTDRSFGNSGHGPVAQVPPNSGNTADHVLVHGTSETANVASSPSEPNTSGSKAELEQAEERLAQMSARANSAKQGVNQIRSQQEAQGLGMRGDVETTEGLLDRYLSSANVALARSDGAAATRALDKADVELTKLEKFLGR